MQDKIVKDIPELADLRKVKRQSRRRLLPLCICLVFHRLCPVCQLHLGC